MKRVAVIGGGISGLCVARRLARDGKVDVQLFEAADRPGGVIQSSREDGFLYEWAANAFLPDPDGAIELARELGVAVEPAAAAAKKRWVYLDGACRAVPSNPLDAITTSLLSTRAKLRLLAEPLVRASTDEDETVAAFARRRLGPDAATRIIGPFVTGVFAGDAEQLSLRSAFPMLAELDARGGLVRGMISRLKDARKNRGPNAPKRERPRMTAPVGGVQAVTDAVAANLGDRVHTSARLDRIEQQDDGGVVLHFDGHESQSFDQVVLATPAHVSATLVDPLSSELSETLRAIPYVSVAITHLGFDRSQINHPLDGFGVIVADGNPNVRVLGMVFESVLWANRAPDGSALVRCIYGGQRDPKAIDETDETLLSHARDDLREVLGLDCAPTHYHVARQRNAIAQYTVGHQERVAKAESLAEPYGIVLAGSGYHGVAVNKCVSDASRVSAAVYRLLQLAVMCLAFVAVACSGGGSSDDKDESAGSSKANAKANASKVDAQPVTGRKVVDHKAASSNGKLTVTVDWLAAPAKLRGSLGRTRCRTQRRPSISVHTNGGVRDVVVSVLGVKHGKSAAGKPAASTAVTELAVRDCELSPPVVKLARLGATLAIINDDERRHELVVETMTGDRRALIPLAVIGRRYELVPKQAGILRVRDVADPHNVAYVVVPAHPHIAVTGDTGAVELAHVPSGSYKVEAWQRPSSIKLPPKRVVASVDIVAGGNHKLELSLAR